jgi:hypothetical protein
MLVNFKNAPKRKSNEKWQRTATCARKTDQIIKSEQGDVHTRQGIDDVLNGRGGARRAAGKERAELMHQTDRSRRRVGGKGKVMRPAQYAKTMKKSFSRKSCIHLLQKAVEHVTHTAWAVTAQHALQLNE